MNNSKLKIVQTRVIYKYNYVKAKIKIIMLFRLVLDQLTLLHEVLKRKVTMGRSIHRMFLFQAGTPS